MSSDAVDNNILKIGYSVTIGGFIEVSSIEEAQVLADKIRDNDFESFENRMVATHFEGLSWDES